MESFHKEMYEYSFPNYDKDDIMLSERIGAGGSGEVFKGVLTYEYTKHKCIVKKFSRDNYDKEYLLYDDIRGEVEIGHLFIGNSNYQIQLYGYSIINENDNISIYLIMEQTEELYDLTNYLNLDKHWKSLSKQDYKNSTSMSILCHKEDNTIKYWDYIINKDNKLHIIIELAKAVEDLHKFKVVHCDLKPHNILYTNSKIKLIDFGFSKKIENRIEEGSYNFGTCGYMPSETCDGIISFKVDIYSLGVCMLEIWFGDIWPSDSNDYKVCRKYVLNYLNLLKKDNIELYKIVKKCIHTSYEKRPLIKTIMKHLSNLGHNP